VWSVLALSDRDEIFDYIEADNPRAAVAVDELISRQVQLLAQFPEGGRIGRVEGTRELVISQTPYIAAYRVIDNRAHSANSTRRAAMARRHPGLTPYRPRRGAKRCHGNSGDSALNLCRPKTTTDRRTMNVAKSHSTTKRTKGTKRLNSGPLVFLVTIAVNL
jgi:toxin ParE1/3/4